MNAASGLGRLGRSALRPVGCTLGLAACAGWAVAIACGQVEPDSTAVEGPARRVAAAASTQHPSPEAAALAAWEGPSAWGVPIYPDAETATALEASLRQAWVEAGEPPELFAARFGERILVTDASFDRTRDFYLPFVRKILMDHEMQVPGVGSQRMLTGLVQAADGTLVKLTVTRPFLRYPDQSMIERTVIQMGRVGQGI